MSFLSKLFKSKNATQPEPIGPLNEEPPINPEETEKSNDDERLSKGKRWIGSDLDATLAYYDGWEGFDHIGKPIPEMVIRVKEWIAQGFEVRVFTARASHEKGIQPVKDWLKKHHLPEMEVTCPKDFDMIECWDDRGVQVVPNTGQPVLSARFGALPRAPLFGIEHRQKDADAMHEKQGTESPISKDPGDKAAD